MIDHVNVTIRIVSSFKHYGAVNISVCLMIFPPCCNNPACLHSFEFEQTWEMEISLVLHHKIWFPRL